MGCSRRYYPFESLCLPSLPRSTKPSYLQDYEEATDVLLGVSGCVLHFSGIYRVSVHCRVFFLGTEERSDWGYYGVMAEPIGLHQNSLSHTTAAAASVGLPSQVCGHACRVTWGADVK